MTTLQSIGLAAPTTRPITGQIAGASTATLDPRSLGACVLWLDASQVAGLTDGQAVSAWPDLSGQGNHMTQGTGANQPLYKVSIVNGQPVVRFDGTNDYLTVGGSINLITGCSLFVVFNPTTSARQDALLSKQTNDFAFLKWTGGGIAGLGLHKSGTAAIAAETVNGTTGWQIAEATWDGATPTGTGIVYRSGTQLATGTYALASLTNNANLELGRELGTGLILGDISEIIIYRRVLSAGERRQVESYLGIKYAIAVN